MIGVALVSMGELLSSLFPIRQRRQLLARVHVPEFDDAILAAAGQQLAVPRESDGFNFVEMSAQRGQRGARMRTSTEEDSFMALRSAGSATMPISANSLVASSRAAYDSSSSRAI